MANSEQIMDLAVMTEGVEAANIQLLSLKKTVGSLKTELYKVFDRSAIAGYLKAAVQSSGELDKELLVLRLNLGRLKAAIGDAVAPVGAIFIPMINQAVTGAVRLVKSVGKVIGALLGGSEAGEAYGEATEKASDSQKTLTKSSGKLKRALMGFDEINRLNSVSGGSGGTSSSVSTGKVNDTLSPELQIVVNRILALVKPLKEIDFSAAVAAFGRLKEAIVPLERPLFEGLNWAWHNLLVPLAAWTVEDVLPAFLDTLSSGMIMLDTAITALKPAAEWLWQNFLQPIGQWAGEQVIGALGWLREKLDNISIWIEENQELVQRIGIIVAEVTAALALANVAVGEWNGLSGSAVGLIGGFGNSMSWLANPISLVSGAVQALGAAIILLITNWNGVKAAAVDAWSGIRNAWAGVTSWFGTNILLPLQNGFRNSVNGIIGFLNGMIVAVTRTINGIVNAVNQMQFTVPNWVPGLGGKNFGFNLRTVSTPQIPYLAQGAVLPANKPFMAVVGDQRHGTNVEAPLATIQEAVAMVMGDQTAAILAGFESSVGVQREILQAVLGIQIGDDVIGQAVSRYQRKMAVVMGG